MRLFGTDGIRGLANAAPMTGEVAMAVGRAMAHVLHQHPEFCAKSSTPVAGPRPLLSRRKGRRLKIVLGKDTRLANYMIETAMVSGLCSMGADVYLIGPMTTPGVAYITQSTRADAGIMISASHNPYHDTGIKIFQADGYKIPDDVEREIERLVRSEELKAKLPVKDLLGKAFRIDDAIGRYVVFLKSLFPKEFDLQGVRVAIDCAHGAGYKLAPLVFEELGAEVIRLGVSPNGLNINEESGALCPQVVAEAVRRTKANIGIALDGDGDRCILADENGDIVDGDQIIGLCALQMAKEGTLRNSVVVTTPMSNAGLGITLKQNGIEMVRADVGDRHVVETMRARGANLGGEQSGHLIFLDEATTGDGVIAALKVLSAMIRTGRPLSHLKQDVRLFDQVREDLHVKRKEPLERLPTVMTKIREAESTLGDRGRVVVRYSGTEALARVMVEGDNRDEIRRLAAGIRSAIAEAVGDGA